MNAAAWVVAGAVFGLAGWGLVPTARELHRRGALRTRTLMGSYWDLLRRLPRTMWTTAKGSTMHPFAYEGRSFVQVVIIVAAAAFCLAAAVRFVTDLRLDDLVVAISAAFILVGLGVDLVRASPCQEGGTTP